LIRDLFATLGFILRHPLARRHRLDAVGRYLRWQVGSRLLPGAVAVPFVGDTRLLARPGMTGATGNVYSGLHEFEDMSLVLHALRPGDLFVDVGANIGSYTVLAAGVCGASVVAVEPIPGTFAALRDNLRLNGLEEAVEAVNIGLSDAPGELRFSATLDTVNHALSDEEAAFDVGVRVAVDTLDSVLAGREPTLIKIDVEGFETKVVGGATRAFASDALLGVLMELNGSGARYGFDDARLHEELTGRGFEPYAYDPFGRELRQVSGVGGAGNVLYVRNLPSLTERVRGAQKRTVRGVEY
jgi:FkbM family methyltransferase